jgi:hypothetical protein
MYTPVPCYDGLGSFRTAVRILKRHTTTVMVIFLPYWGPHPSTTPVPFRVDAWSKLNVSSSIGPGRPRQWMDNGIPPGTNSELMVMLFFFFFKLFYMHFRGNNTLKKEGSGNLVLCLMCLVVLCAGSAQFADNSVPFHCLTRALSDDIRLFYVID